MREPKKESTDKISQTDHQIDVQKKNALNVQKSLEILEITDIPEPNIEVSFKKKDPFSESQEDYRTPSDFIEPLNQAMAEQIDQLIKKLNDSAEGCERI